MKWIVKIIDSGRNRDCTEDKCLEVSKFESYKEALGSIDLYTLSLKYDDHENGIQIFILNSCGIMHFEASITF